MDSNLVTSLELRDQANLPEVVTLKLRTKMKRPSHWEPSEERLANRKALWQ